MRGRIRRFALQWARRLTAAALAMAAALLALVAAFPFPRELLAPPPLSPAVLDREGRPLLVLAASDGRWRLPVRLDRVSPWLPLATIAVEDSGFRAHLGVDPGAALRAVAQNAASGRVVSGASTLTMQFCRMLSPRPRNLASKAVETFRAFELELSLCKDDILEGYLSRAPYGGGVEGAEAASLVWFSRPAADLSLPEAALLAGLPQSPTRLRPDIHPERARARRDFVLARMEEEGIVTATQRVSAARAPVRVDPLRGTGERLSADAGRHAAFLALSRRPLGGRTTIDLPLQRIVESAAREHAASLPPGCDVAVVAIDVKAAEIVALVGSADFEDPADGQVNGAVAPRSPGSALKPFLYAAAFDTGRLAPDTVIPDREVAWGAYRPKNFDGGFRGAVPAAEALRRSLNIPAILVAEAVGLSRCLNVLRAAGIALPADAATRGGLAMATGALEVRLLDLANAYATLARGGVFRPARLFPDEAAEERRAVSSEAAAAVSAILSVRERVPASLADRPADSIPWFAWKTGTSSGRRDALAAGHNGRYAVAVWAGRFPGQGDFALTGAAAAEPLLARLFLNPALAATGDPPPPPVLPVCRPFFVDAVATGPAILSPAPDTVYAALSGAATVAVDVRPAEGLTLFLNGALLDPPAAAALSIRPGVHELRAVDAAGRAAAVTFTVR